MRRTGTSTRTATSAAWPPSEPTTAIGPSAVLTTPVRASYAAGWTVGDGGAAGGSSVSYETGGTSSGPRRPKRGLSTFCVAAS